LRIFSRFRTINKPFANVAARFGRKRKRQVVYLVNLCAIALKLCYTVDSKPPIKPGESLWFCFAASVASTGGILLEVMTLDTNPAIIILHHVPQNIGLNLA